MLKTLTANFMPIFMSEKHVAHTKLSLSKMQSLSESRGRSKVTKLMDDVVMRH